MTDHYWHNGLVRIRASDASMPERILLTALGHTGVINAVDTAH